MCYFHVCLNVKKHTRSLSRENKNSITEDIRTLHILHISKDKKELSKTWMQIKQKWLDLGFSNQFVDYFEAWWIKRESKWQIFRSPIGFSATNNPLESYNHKKKSQFTNRTLMSMF
jgi:hypothetical protein